MTISEDQLRSWSQLGAQVRSQRTYESIQNALARHAWPSAMGSPSVYLQGSYRNHTNIAGDSDVDVVVETSGVFYDNLTPEERQLLGIRPGSFTWTDFRDEVYRALASHYSQWEGPSGQQEHSCRRRGRAAQHRRGPLLPVSRVRRCPGRWNMG